ncbi:MAG: hypothetical protein RLQ12_18685 [Cyclobacteriaceae bacterium]
MSNKSEIEKLENNNAELAKEILLNEAAIYETEKEMSEIETQLLEHPKIQQYVNNLRLLVDRIKLKNQLYKNEIFQNDLEIAKLRKEDNDNE